MAGNQGDRTEKPTERRLRDARKKGQIARSRDLGQAVSLAAAIGTLAWYGDALLDGLGVAVRRGLEQMGRTPTRDLHIEDLSPILFDGIRTLVVLVGPLACAVAVAVVATHTVQGGWVFATESLQLNWSRLSPANNVKRLGPSKAGLDLVKMLVVASTLTFLAFQAIEHALQGAGQLARLAPIEAARAGWADAQRLLRLSAVALLAVGAADYGLQRWRHTSSLKMTRQEVKDDFRLTEGNPEIKARVRRVQMAMARGRMLTAVPGATVVVTNPTHYAVALEYRRGEMAAPRVVAKGRGFTAALIKDIARAHGVPTVENVPLAQALWKSVEVGDTIPAALFEAVAEVLAYLIRLKQLVV
ncbi:MAG TPA: EscU/YscU/HrcU family type III secretion system export apparatus switch protein [Vicinamibacterales bacterium]|nr:EscU/YscU/HrcU family type III secretion system export apparatus switch protein [Vicinamibacterales bacterium]